MACASQVTALGVPNATAKVQQFEKVVFTFFHLLSLSFTFFHFLSLTRHLINVELKFFAHPFGCRWFEQLIIRLDA